MSRKPISLDKDGDTHKSYIGYDEEGRRVAYPQTVHTKEIYPKRKEVKKHTKVAYPDTKVNDEVYPEKSVVTLPKVEEKPKPNLDMYYDTDRQLPEKPQQQEELDKQEKTVEVKTEDEPEVKASEKGWVRTLSVLYFLVTLVAIVFGAFALPAVFLTQSDSEIFGVIAYILLGIGLYIMYSIGFVASLSILAMTISSKLLWGKARETYVEVMDTVIEVIVSIFPGNLGL